MAWIFDGATKLITEVPEPGNPPLVEYEVRADLWSPAEEWWADNMNWPFPFRLAGGEFRRTDNLGNPVYQPFDFFLQNQVDIGWRLKPANYQHVIRFFGANLLPEDQGLSIWTLTGLTSAVIIDPVYSDFQSGYVVDSGGGGGGYTSSDRTRDNAIASKVAELHKVEGLESGVAVTATDTSRSTSDGAIEQVIADNGASTTISRQ